MSLAELDEMIESLKRLEGLPEEAAKRAAEHLDEAVKASASAGQSPDGKPWDPKKSGKGRPLEHVADHIQTKAHGATIRQTLTGPEVYHHYGTKRVPQRQVIPDAGGGNLPERVTDAIRKGATEAFDAAIKK